METKRGKVQAMNDRKQIPTFKADYLDHVPPKAIDLEASVLGTIMQYPGNIYEIADILTPDAFYKDEHQKVCNAIMSLFETNRKIDLMTVTEKLRSLKQLDEIGGALFVTQLSANIYPPSHLKEHYYIVFQKYIQREMIRDAQEALVNLFDDSIDLEMMIAWQNEKVDKINEKVAGKRQFTHISTAIAKSEEALKEREKASKENKLVGIKTPVRGLDQKFQGWKTNVYVTAASSGEGKTAAALAYVKTAAETGKACLVYSLEMQDVTLADRLILAEADIDEYHFQSGYMSKAEWVEFNRAKARLSKLPIYIDDNPIVNFTYIKVHSRMMKKRGLCDMIVLDYLQIAETEKDSSREREIAKFMRNCVILKKELDVPVHILSQINKDYDNRKTKRPTLGMARESGAIVQDADAVIFVYRPEYHGIMENEDGVSWKGHGLFIVAKNRNGPTGDVDFSYNTSVTKITNWEDPRGFQKPEVKAPPKNPELYDIRDESPF